MNLLEKLQVFNGVTFFPEGHRYLYHSQGEASPLELLSVTTFLDRFVPEFPRDETAERVAQKKNRPVADILEDWDRKRDLSCEKGHLFHTFAEQYLANKHLSDPTPELIEKYGEDPFGGALRVLFQQFKAFVTLSSRSLVPVKSEWVIGDREWRLGGMIDQLYYNRKSRQLEIWDWKTNGKLTMSNPFGRSLEPPLAHLSDCHWHKYSLQLALYRAIVEKNTGLTLGNNYLVWFHEKNEAFQVIRCFNVGDAVSRMLEADSCASSA
jgi:hypothetical protein